MYRLLIVDDEYQARNGLRDLVDWQALGICVAGDAEDGDIALPMLDTLRPDILLTDVRMNRMDGLTLAREARRRMPGIEIVFISGYSDAEYLRDALRVEAYDYLYKPIRINELREMMRRLVARLDARAEANAQLERSRLLVEKSRPLLLDRFMRSWIGGMLEDEATMRAQLALLDLAIPEGCGMAAAAFQPEWPTFPSAGQAAAYLMLLEEAVRAQFDDALLSTEETGLVALLPLAGETAPTALDSRFQAVAEQMRGVTDAALLIGVSGRHGDWTEVPDAVAEAQRAVERRLDADEQTVLYYSAEASLPEPVPGSPDEGLVERHLLTGSFDALWHGVEDMLSGLESNTRDAEHARKLLMDCALRADIVLQRRGLPGIDALSFCKRALAHRTIAPVKGALKSALEEACALILDQQEGGYSAAVEQVLGMIRTRYAQRLSVDDLAEAVHYSPAHLSTLFRQETGMTIGDALFRTRLDAAMALLRATREPVSAIAQQTGYTDVQYFSRVFKRFTGITPLEYRKRVPPC